MPIPYTALPHTLTAMMQHNTVSQPQLKECNFTTSALLSALRCSGRLSRQVSKAEEDVYSAALVVSSAAGASLDSPSAAGACSPCGSASEDVQRV